MYSGKKVCDKLIRELEKKKQTKAPVVYCCLIDITQENISTTREKTAKHKL